MEFITIYCLLYCLICSFYFIISKNLGFEVSSLTLYLSCIYALQISPLCHYHHIVLCPATTANFLCFVFMGGCLYCKTPFMGLYHTFKGVTIISLPHCLAKFMNHNLNGFITLQSQLALNLFTRKTFFSST